jgi:type III secretion protein C
VSNWHTFCYQKSEKKDLGYTNTLGLTIIKTMVSERTVRIFFSTILFCMSTFCAIGQAHAKEVVTKAAPLKEVAATYLETPPMMIEGNVCPMDLPCGNCGGCEYCQPYFIDQQEYACPPPEVFLNAGPHAPPYAQQPPPQQPPPQQQPPHEQQQTQQKQQQSSNTSPLPPNRLSLQPSPPVYKKPNCGPKQEGYTVNYENISIIELIKFISRISGVNYIFDSSQLLDQAGQPFKVTLISEDPTQVADLSAALLQVLSMYGLSVVEQGRNVLIHKSQNPPNLSKVSTVITEDNVDDSCDNAVITRVFQLFNVDPVRIAGIVKTLLSPYAVVDASIETRHLIVTDITANVNKIADLLSALDTPTLPIDVDEYQVQHADPVTLAEYAREILGPIAGPTPFNVTPESVAMRVFIVGTPVLINRAKQIMASLDVPEITSLNPLPIALSIENNDFYMYKLKYQDGQEIAAALRDIGSNLQFSGSSNIDFVNAIYSAQWLEVNNSIVLTGTPEAIQKVVRLLDDLDQLPKQVYIEVLVLDNLLQNSLDFGVQWIALGDEQNKLAFATGLLANGNTLQSSADALALARNPNTGTHPGVPNPGNITLPTPSNLVGLPDIVNATEAFSLGILGNIIRHNGQSFLTLGALLSALDEQEDTKVVINPKIMVEDTQPANFFVGQNIPYQTTSTVIQQTGSVTQNIQYEDIGVQLQVTPTIAPNNMVTLQINQTVADIQGIAGATLTPVTNKELVTTRVHVPNGAFLVMSGHTRDVCSTVHSGIP